MDYRKAGFSQRKPKQAGVYFISCETISTSHPPHTMEGWDVAEVYFYAGSYGNVYEQSESHAAWKIKSLRGIEYYWKPGMWIKGPIAP